MASTPTSDPAPLDVLRAASVFARGGEGFAGSLSPEAFAFQSILRDRRALAGRYDELVAMLRDATPAGRVFAATLLAEVNAGAGRDAWASLAGCLDPVIFHAGGCSPRLECAVDDIARAMLRYEDTGQALHACIEIAGARFAELVRSGRDSSHD